MKFRPPELVLGCLLTVAIFSVGMLFSPQISWLTKDAGGFFTFALVIVGLLQALLFWVQLRLIRESLVPTKEAADAAKLTAGQILNTERAYLFLKIEIEEKFKEFRLGSSIGTHDHSKIEFGFKNHGKTPAIVEEIHVAAQYWPSKFDWPAMSLAAPKLIQKGLVISGGDFVASYDIQFPLSGDQLKWARDRDGYILFWGKVVYSDVFKHRHETGWCRGYLFNQGWRFAGDEHLNYYT
jgi:hypothetical protein